MTDENPKPATAGGWICPRCGRALAPDVKVCPACPPYAEARPEKAKRLDYTEG